MFPNARPATMIRFLASIFRGVHFVLGITAPQPGHDERAFVLIWLAVVGVILVFFVGLIYFIPYIYVRR
jgi:hypothetical protein